MKRQMMISAYLLLSSLLFAGEVSIDNVVTFANDEKTSVVISYSGTDQLRFFALDSADGVFSLDLPGVFSKFDFSTLTFAQVRKVHQEPLDPDVSNGISVRFFLHKGVTYHVFETKGSLTLFFEGVPEAESVEVAEVPATTSPVAAPRSNVSASLEGSQGQGRLHKVSVEAEHSGGIISLSTADLDSYSYFFLDGPKRFVVDLRDTVLGLDTRDIDMDHPLVERVRIRQFQSHPVAITRVVLDLSNHTNVNALQTPGGVSVYFADTNDHLVALMESAIESEDNLNDEATEGESFEAVADTNASLPSSNDVPENVESLPVEEANEVVAQAEAIQPAAIEVPSEERVADEMVASAKKDEPFEHPVTADVPLSSDEAEDVATPVENSVAEVLTDDSVADVQTETSVAEVHADKVSDNIEENASLGTAKELVVAEHEVMPITTPAEAKEEADSGLEASEEVFVSESTDDQQEVSPVEKVALTEAPSSETDLDGQEASEAQEVSTPVASETAEDTSIPGDISEEPAEQVAMEEPATEAPSVLEPIKEEVVSENIAKNEFEVVTTDVPSEDEVTEIASVDESDDESFIKDVVAEAKSSDESFVMASDVDLEMQEFLDENLHEQPLHRQMAGMKSTRSHSEQVRVTNNRISEFKALSEASNLQDEDGEDEGQLTDLFEEEDSPFQTVETGEEEYRGFPIMIDIREQPVLDLLRFLADEVGFNLYVDSSVSEGLRATYSFRNIPWDQALDIILSNAGLAKEFRSGVLRVATMAKFQREEEERKRLMEAREDAVPIETVTVELNYARARDLHSIIYEYLSRRGSIIRDDRTNILIIRDIPKNMVTIRTLIARLDRRIPQVSIEARIVETSTRFLKELGIQWGLTAQYSPETGTDTGIDFPHRVGLGGPFIGQARSALGPEGGYAVNFPVASNSGFGLTLGNFLDNFKLDISMQLLESEGQGQVISSPKVTTQNNRTAIITSGQRIPIQTVNRGTVTTRFINAVLELQVTPQITSEETIIMDLVIDKSEPDFSRATGVGGNPIINISKAETQVLVKNGGTAVIGGIFALTESTSTSGIPVMRKIPVVRRLFSNERNQLDNQELLIFVTPKIVKY